MNRIFSVFSFVAVFLLTASVHAQDYSTWRKYSQVSLVAETTGFAPGAQGTIGFRLHMEKGWHAYWLHPGDSGSPIEFHFKTGSLIKIEKVLFPIPERLETGPLMTFGYTRDVLIPIDVKISPNAQAGDTIHIETVADWLICADVCIPASQKLTLNVPVQRLENIKPSSQFLNFQYYRNRVPERSSDQIRFVPSTIAGSEDLVIPRDAQNETFIDFFPFRGSGVTNEQPILVSQHPLRLRFKKSRAPQIAPDRIGVLIFKNNNSHALQSVQFGHSGWTFSTGAATPKGHSLWWMLVFAFLGGLILNLMPCVFPVLSIKLLSLLKLSQSNPGEVRRQNFAYVAGVIGSFIAMALVLASLRAAGHLIGWGFQLQSPVFVAILIWLFVALTLNLLGLFEFDLLDANIGHKMTRLGGIWGSFFTGVLAVIVASPCTAPFMGVALGFGLSQPTAILISIFLALGLGLAFPYLLFGIFPAWSRILPKPGMWMIWTKRVMAVPLFLTAVWLAWVLWETHGPAALFWVGGAAIAEILVFVFRRNLRKVALVATALGMVSAMIYIVSVKPEGLSDNKKVDGLWRPYSERLMSGLNGKNVFVDMSADWCLTCKVNERLVLDASDVLQFLKAKNVILVRGDWTRRNPEITRFLTRYHRAGVPFYVFFSAHHPEGVILPQVLTKSSFEARVQKAIGE